MRIVMYVWDFCFLILKLAKAKYNAKNNQQV